MTTDPATRIIRAAVERAHDDPPESEPEMGGLLARPWRVQGKTIINRHGHALLVLAGLSAEEDDRIAAIVLGAINPPLSGKEGRGG